MTERKTRKTEKEGTVKRRGSVLWILLRKFLGKRAAVYFGCILLMVVCGSVFQIMVSVTIGGLCDMARQGTAEGLRELLAGNLPVIVFAMAGNLAGTIGYNDEAKRVGTKINNEVFAKALRLPMHFYDTHHSGEFMSKIIWDAGRTCDVFGSRLRRVIMPVLTVGVCVVPMFYLCPPVMAGLFTMSCISLWVHFRMIGPMKRAGKDATQANQKMTESISNMLQGMEVMKMFPVREEIVRRYGQANGQLKEAGRKQADYAAFLRGLNTAFDLLGSFCFLALGIWYIGAYHGEVGSLVSLYLLYGTFNWNFLQIGRYVPDLANCLINGERVLEFLELEEEPFVYGAGAENGIAAAENTGAEGNTGTCADFAKHGIPAAYLEVRDLTFGYGGAEEKVLEHYSAAFAKGSFVAVTGASGRGKSTLAKLILGFYPPETGDIYLEGQPMGVAGIAAFRDKIAYVPQEPYLYNVSIAENIRYGKPEAGREEIVAAAKAAHAHDFIMKQEHGYDTVAGERGAKLSGGERQRIAIARAVLRDAPILLMDEATSALDNESEQLVQDALRKLKGEKTVIMIAHRPSTIEAADVMVKV